MLLGIDTGGTFTDFVLLKDGVLLRHKVLSTPQAPEKAILQGIHDLALNLLDGTQTVFIVHGSTVATNAVLEAKGVRTAYICNKGLADVLSIGRQTRPQLYSLQSPPLTPPVEQQLCVEVDARLSASAEVITALTDGECERLHQTLLQLNPAAVAINLLFSWLDETHEKQLAACIPKGIFVSRSSLVLPEYKEYERGITTWLNAYVGPLVDGYLHRFQQNMPDARISVMQSSGGTIDAAQASNQAVRMLLSGPAGGMAGAQYMGKIIGCERLLTFDMGGTSTDVAMIDRQIQLTTQGRIGRFPVAVPMVDLHTIGAGGGSIASVDSAGLLQVGPESAGADPGPACYALGGQQATVTDANLLLGRLRADAFLGGAITLDIDAAKTAIGKLASQISLDVHALALGIIRIANQHMAQALRVMPLQRGLDARDMRLVSFGGAGGLHVCALADALQMRQALIPVYAGVLSAFGMLVAPKARYLSRSMICLLKDINPTQLENCYAQLIQQGHDSLQQEDVNLADITIHRELDVRYAGQSSFITIVMQDFNLLEQTFHQYHQQRYGHRLDLEIEVVNVRVTLIGPSPVDEFKQDFTAMLSRAEQTTQHNQNISARNIKLYGINQPVACLQRESLTEGQIILGPTLICETISTSYIATDWQAKVDAMGNLLLNRI